MAYVNPETVVSPRNRIRSVDVLYDDGAGSWSVALLDYDGRERLGIRWNGENGESGIGNPQSRARPTWFVLPDELAAVVREQVEQLANSQEGGLLAGYREMANDREREAKAQEWCEGLTADAANQEG
jgi:hypothetical protein